MRKKVLKISIFSAACALMAVSLAGYNTVNYFYLFAHIQSFSDFVLCLLLWVKLAGLVVVAASVFMRSKRFSIVLKYIYCIAPLLLFFWAERYLSLAKIPQTDAEHIYFSINNFMPAALIKVLFYLESALMSLIAILTAIKDGFKIKSEYKSLKVFMPVFLLTIPLNIFKNIVNIFPEGLYNFLYFRNFSVWHFSAFILLFGLTALTYRFLKNKSSTERYRYMSLLAIVLLVQYMSRASMLLGDGYNVYRTAYAFIPLFVCSIGVPVACLAVFTKNKRLSDISFFVHAPGAFSVFVYFGKEGMSEFGTIFDYTFLYFVFYHTLLFISCVVPVLLKEHKFNLKRCAVPLVYFAAFLLSASAASQMISAVDYSYGDTVLNISPNFSFTQNSPIVYNLPPVLISIFNLQFDILYLSLLFTVHIVIFFAFYFLYYFFIAKKQYPVSQRIIAATQKAGSINTPETEAAATVDDDTALK